MAIKYSGTEGTCQWTIDDQGHLYIGSGVISHNTTSGTDWSWHSYKNEIISVSSGNVSWAIGANAYGMFYDCESLTSLNLSSFDTSNVTNMNRMFYFCNSLTSIDLSSFNTSNVTDMTSMFYNCRQLTSLDVSNFNTSNVANMFAMFGACSFLTSLNLSNFNTSNVTNMGSIFHNCKALTSLDVSSFDTSNVTNMDQMFNHCDALTSLDLSNFDTSNVTAMSFMFAHCFALTTLNVSNFNTSNVTTMRAMFNCDYNLTKIKGLTNFDTSKVTIMRFMFANDESVDSMSLTSLNLSSFDTSQVTDMQEMFENCQLLETIYVSDKWSTSAIENSTDMFKDCVSLIGEQDTVYDSSQVDKTYAHIDGGISNPGYFTNGDSLPEAYASFDSISDELKIFRDLENEYDINGVGEAIGNITYWSGIEDITGYTNPKWYDIRADIQSVQILNKFSPKTAYNIFRDCEQLTSFDLSNFDTSNVVNMDRMFYNCKSLTSLNLSNFDTSNVTSMDRVFGSCESLTSLDLSNFNTSNVINMNGIFSYCDSLISLDLSSLDTSNVTNMSGMFSHCGSLVSLDLSNFDTSKVTCMSWMFDGCQLLASLNLLSFNTINVTDMGYMFNDCYSLISLNLSNFNTSSITNMSYMFGDCKSLTSLDLSNFNTSNVTNMRNMFDACNNLVSLNITSFDTSNVINIEGMFQSCNSLISLDLSNFNTSKVINMNRMFSYCTALQCIIVSNLWNINTVTTSTNMFINCTSLRGGAGTTYNSSTIDVSMAHIDEGVSNPGYLVHINNTEMYASFDSDNGQLTIFRDVKGEYDSSGTGEVRGTVTYWGGIEDITRNTYPKWYDKRVNIQEVKIFNKFIPQTAYGMFEDCNALVSLDLSNLDTNNVTDMRYMFEKCSALTALDLSNFDTSSVTSMSYMFENCSALISLDLSNFDTNNVKYMTGMFRNCSALTVLDLSSFNTSNVTSMSNMFDNCSSLTSLDLSNFDTSKVTSISQMFSSCTHLTSLDLSSFNTSAVLYMMGTFWHCYSLTTLDISNFNTSKVRNMSCMFSYFGRNSSLTSLDLSHFDTSNVVDMSQMFEWCDRLTTLDISKFNTSNVTNMSTMFYGCESLTSLDVSSFDTGKVTSMYQMFANLHLQTILVSEKWTVASVISSSNMFMNSSHLVGEKGTSFNSGHTDATYAHIDGGTSNPGYLTNINSVPCYASFDSSNGELKIFRDVSGKYVDNQVIGTKTYWTGIEDITEETNPKWYDECANILLVNIIHTFNPKTAFNMFRGCKNLTSLNLSNLNTSNITNMCLMFCGCTHLTSFDLSNFNTSNVVDMEQMFAGCQSLISLDVSCFDTSNVINMTYMFGYCSSLTSLDLSSFDTSNVVSMTYMFAHCESLTSLNLSTFNTIKVTDMSHMFEYCRSLDYLEFYVNNNPSSTTRLFTIHSPNQEYYIINKGAADATFWRNFVAGYGGYIHYEADDLTITFNKTQEYAPTVTRKNLSVGSTKFMDSYVDIDFYYQTNNLLPHSWNLNISQIKSYLQGETSPFLDDNSPSTSILNQHYTKTVECLKNNKAQAILELYITIHDAYNTTKIDNQLIDSITINFIGYNKPIISHNSNIFINEDDENNKFLYQIIGSTQQVGICAHNETYNYNNVTIPTEVIFDGNTYIVTKLNIDIYDVNGNSTVYGCFENNITVTGINSISTNITTIDRSFYGCTALEGNIIFLPTNNINYTNAFTGTTKNIFLIDSNDPDNIIDNPIARNIAYAFSNVHYEADDNVAPTITLNIPTQRRIYNQETHTWEDNDDGEWIPATIKINLASNSLPVGWTNEIKSFNCTANSTNTNLKTEDYQDVTKNDFITTPEGDPTIIYIEIGTQAVMLEFTVIDRFGKTITITRKINPIFAMLDFMPGGHGMSIGKIANRNGLDIAIPTAIGEGLLLPTVVNSNSVDLTKYQLVVGQYNQQNNDATFIIGNGRNINNPSNLLEINAKLNENSLIFGSNPGIRGNLTITLGENLMAEYNNQIVIGKNNNNLSTSVFEIGNGLDNNNRSNAITIDWNGNITRGDGASYTAVQITRWT